MSSIRRRDFALVYEQQVDFVWKRLRRLGVPTAGLQDGAQDVFLVVHRKLGELPDDWDVRHWILGIVVHVAQRQWRTYRRKERPLDRERLETLDTLPDERAANPAEQVEQQDVLRLLYQTLDQLDPVKREVFVLTELEQCTAPHIANLLQIPLNTVYSRLRAARAEFERALARARAKTKESLP